MEGHFIYKYIYEGKGESGRWTGEDGECSLVTSIHTLNT